MMQRLDTTLETTVIGHQREEEETDINLLLHDPALGNDIKIKIEMITIIQTETETDLGTRQTTKIDTATHEMITLAQPEKSQKNEIGIQVKRNQCNTRVPLDSATTRMTQESQIVKSFSVA